MNWTGIIIHTKEEALELVTSMLYSMGIIGLEILDYVLDDEDKQSLFIDYIDEDINNLKDTIRVKCYVSEEENVNRFIENLKINLNNLQKMVDVGSCKIELINTKEEDWANNWKKYFKTFKVSDNIYIKPTWEEVDSIEDNSLVIEIDPGMAFGSGTHETTSMCIQLIQKYINKENIVIDVGCGSGILGIAAAKLGAKKVECIDVDRNAVKVAKKNIEQNNLNSTITVKHGDLIENTSEKADIVVANIMADIIILLTEDIKKVLVPKGIYITSGIIQSKCDEVQKKLESCGFTILEKKQKGEWVAIAATLKE